jgi:hypothetical protein
MNKNEYLELLSEFESLPFQSETIFDIAGFPHYENVCSNILKFYLNPNNEHGLGDLFLSSLMCFVPEAEYESKPEFIKIDREVATIKGGRIDIVIETKNLIIGIENKIFHYLANDFADYSESIDGWAKQNDLKQAKIILGLRKVSTKELESSGFISVTYKNLWAEIKKRLGGYVSTSSQKWLLYLVDFMTSIEKLNGGNMEQNEIDKFFIKNAEKVNALINAKNEFDSKLHGKVNELFKTLNQIDADTLCKKRWIYLKSCLVYDFILGNDYSIAFDLVLYPKGWTLMVFGRNSESRSYLSELFELTPLCDIKNEVKRENSRYILELTANDLNADLSGIEQQFLEWVNRVLRAEANKQQGQTNTISQACIK